MRTNDVQVLAKAYETIREASLSTGNVPGAPYGPYGVSPALKAAGKRLAQGAGELSSAISNPAASLEAGKSYANNTFLNAHAALQGRRTGVKPEIAALHAFSGKEYQQAIELLLRSMGLPDNLNSRQQLSQAISRAKHNILTSQMPIDPEPARITGRGSEPIPLPPTVPSVPSKIAVRPK